MTTCSASTIDQVRQQAIDYFKAHPEEDSMLFRHKNGDQKPLQCTVNKGQHFQVVGLNLYAKKKAQLSVGGNVKVVREGGKVKDVEIQKLIIRPHGRGLINSAPYFFRPAQGTLLPLGVGFATIPNETVNRWRQSKPALDQSVSQDFVRACQDKPDKSLVASCLYCIYADTEQEDWDAEGAICALYVKEMAITMSSDSFPLISFAWHSYGRGRTPPIIGSHSKPRERDKNQPGLGRAFKQEMSTGFKKKLYDAIWKGDNKKRDVANVAKLFLALVAGTQPEQISTGNQSASLQP